MLSFLKQKEKVKQDEILRRVEEQLQKQGKRQEEQWTAVQDNIQKLLSRQRKSEIVTESLLEMIEEHTNAFLSQDRIKSNEKSLAEYILKYDESLHHMERMLRKSEGEASEWAKQLNTSRQQLCDRMKEIEVSIIKDSGVPVDFRIHEIVSIQYTTQSEKRDKVCEIIVPGLSYQKEVLRKAKITAYKYQEETNQ